MKTDPDETTADEHTGYHLFTNPAPSPHLQLTVIVPVRNEAHHLVRTLEALRNQRDAEGNPLNPAIYEVLLLANNCTDHSYEVAVRYGQRYPDFPLHVARIRLPPAKANIGTARRLLMDEAHRRLTSTGNANGIIASTDGDTEVDTHWIQGTMTEIAGGSDAVGGRILTRPAPGPVRAFHLRDVMYRTLVAKAEARLDPVAHDPWPRHFQHFGASLAVTCRTYERVGGLPRKPYLEDEAFYRALVRIDAKVRQSPRVKVITSTRQQGRVAVGFSEQLRYWAHLDRSRKKMQMAEPPEAVITRLRCRGQLRDYWPHRFGTNHPDALTSVARALFIEPRWLRQTVRRCVYFGQLWEKVEQRMAAGRWGQHWKPVPIRAAIGELRQYLAGDGATPCETNPAGTYRPADPADASVAGPNPPPPETLRVPHRPSADSRAQRASSGPAADARPASGDRASAAAPV